MSSKKKENNNIKNQSWNWIDESFLTHDSYNIVYFLYNNMKNNSDNMFKKIESSSVLKKLFMILIKPYIYYRNNLKKNYTKSYLHNLHLIRSSKEIREITYLFNEGPFVPTLTKKYLNNIECIVESSIKENHTKKHVFVQFLIHKHEDPNHKSRSKHEKNKTEAALLRDIINRYSQYIFYFSLYGLFMMNFSDKDTIKITTCLTPFCKKITDNSNKTLGPNEINTGSTSFFSLRNIPEHNLNDHNPILLWRKEEVSKVCIHELFHSNEFDTALFGLGNNKKVQHIFHNLFDIPSKIEIRLNESYTEMWAVLIHSMITSVEYHKRNNKKIVRNKIFKTFMEILLIEIEFVCFQIAKILLHFEYTDLCQFYKHGFYKCPQRLTNIEYSQDTAVFSYFFIKGALLFSYSKFISFCIKHHKHNDSLLKFPNNKNTKNKYIELIQECWGNKRFHKKIKRYIDLLNTKSTLNNKIKNTLRLTSVEFQIDIDHTKNI